MVGNVFEWVFDWSPKPRFSNLPYTEKVNRGGSFNRPKEHCTTYYWESDPPWFRMADVGFRCAFSYTTPKEMGLEYVI